MISEATGNETTKVTVSYILSSGVFSPRKTKFLYIDNFNLFQSIWCLRSPTETYAGTPCFLVLGQLPHLGFSQPESKLLEGRDYGYTHTVSFQFLPPVYNVTEITFIMSQDSGIEWQKL